MVSLVFSTGDGLIRDGLFLQQGFPVLVTAIYLAHVSLG